MAGLENNLNSGPFIGIDVGASSIKIIEAQKSEAGLAVLKANVRSVVENEVVDAERVSEIIKDMMAEAGMTAVNAVFTVGGNMCTIRHFDFPKMQDDSLGKTIRFELKKDINYPIDDCMIDYIVTREFEAKNDEGVNQKRIKVLIAAIEARHIEKIKEVALKAGLVLVAVVPSSAALYSLAKKMKPFDECDANDITMFFDFGNSQMTVNFMSKEGLKFSKDINMGGSTLTTVIKTMYSGNSKLSAEEAEIEKFKIGLLPEDQINSLDDASPNVNLHKVLNVSFKKLLQRIRLSTGYFFAHFMDHAQNTQGSQTIKKIFLHGGNSEIPGVEDYFAENYESDILKIDPWTVAAISEKDEYICRKYGLALVNIIAAMHEFFYPEYSLNLKKEKKDETVQKAAADKAIDDFISKKLPVLERFSRFGIANIVIGLTLFYVAVLGALVAKDYFEVYKLGSAKKDYDARFAELNSDQAVAERKKINEQYNIYLKKIDVRKAIEFKKPGLDMIFLEISEKIPEGITLFTVHYSNEDQPVLNITGATAQYDKVLKFNEILKKNKAFSNVVVKKTDQNESRVEFQFECALTCEAKE